MRHWRQKYNVRKLGTPTYLDCIPCFFRQAHFAARLVLKDESRIKGIMDEVGRLLPHIPMDSSPPETGRQVYKIVHQATGIQDPFKELKDESIEKASRLYPDLKRMVDTADDPLEMAVRLAIAGNVIDFGANPGFQLEQDLKKIIAAEPAINHYPLFTEALADAQNVFFLGDNAGETVFDKLLIETIGRRVVYAVRGEPIINDATVEDARKSGLDEVAEIISSGCDAPGFILERCSKEFRHHFETADLIISKGQGNRESLSRERRPIFFLLKAKCSVVAEELGVTTGDTVIQYASSKNENHPKEH